MHSLPQWLPLFLLTSVGCQSQPTPQSTPQSIERSESAVRFETGDLERFWATFDRVQALQDPAQRAQLWQSEYFDTGTPGLQDFFRIKIKDVQSFAQTVEQYQAFYSSTRDNMGRTEEHRAKLDLALEKVKELIPGAQFPTVTLLVGCLTFGGTLSDEGLLIGLELVSSAPDSPLETLPLGLQRVARQQSHLVPGIVHELAHSLQDQTQGGRSLLMASLMEGGAEYISFLACGPREPLNFYMQWGLEHEAQVWSEFTKDMHSLDTSRWLANNRRATQEWPADLGYFMGFQIARAFHESAEDPAAALAELMQVRDPLSVLERSGYADRNRRAAAHD